MNPRRRLNAAAPLLLEACRHTLRVLLITRDDLAASGSGGSDEGDEICAEAMYLTPVIEELRAAIIKATGEEP